MIAPPWAAVLPLRSVSPEIVIVGAVVPSTLKIREALLPLTASVAAPGPLMVRFLLRTISPDVSVITPVTEPKTMVSPGAAVVTASRRLPAPASPELVTVSVAALAACQVPRPNASPMAAAIGFISPANDCMRDCG